MRLELLEPDSGRVVAEVSQFVQGSGTAPLSVPSGADGSYTLQIFGEGVSGGRFDDSARVQLRAAPVILFLETDKPIYKPGQEIRIRALRLNSDLRPMPGPVTVEIQDAKGIKVYKQAVEADEYGMASASLPLSTEPNLGVWKLTALSGEQSVEQDVRVEEYALPKYEITVNTPQDWILVNDKVMGTVSAEYSFGKPVRGEVEIVALRYVGRWEEYATSTKEIDGETIFELPAPRYVAGSPAAGGQGNLQLNLTVREQGHRLRGADQPTADRGGLPGEPAIDSGRFLFQSRPALLPAVGGRNAGQSTRRRRREDTRGLFRQRPRANCRGIPGRRGRRGQGAG